MAYQKQTWTDNVSQANAARMTHIEDGIAGAEAPVAHSSNTGLTTGDDHTQYHNNARGDARYDAKGTAASGDSAHVAASNPHTQYSPTTHTHDMQGAERLFKLKLSASVPASGYINSWGIGGQSWVVRVSKTDQDGNDYSCAPFMTGDVIQFIDIVNNPMQTWARFQITGAIIDNLTYAQFDATRLDTTGPTLVEDSLYIFSPTDLFHAHSGTYDPAGTASSAVAGHVAAGDPHVQYLTETDAATIYELEGAAADAISAHTSSSSPHPQYAQVTISDTEPVNPGVGHIWALPTISVPEFRAGVTANNASNANIPSVNVPAGVLDGDMGVLVCASSSSTIASITPPSGWSEVLPPTASGNMTVAVYSRRRQSGDSNTLAPTTATWGGWCTAAAWWGGAVAVGAVGATGIRNTNTVDVVAPAVASAAGNVVVGVFGERTGVGTASATPDKGVKQVEYLPANGAFTSTSVVILDLDGETSTGPVTMTYAVALSNNGLGILLSLTAG